MNRTAARSDSGVTQATPLAEELARLAVTEIDGVLSALASPRDDFDHIVHASRKAIKRLCALVRLGACTGDDWRALDRSLRETGRLLGPARDAAVLRHTLGDLPIEAGMISRLERHARAPHAVIDSSTLAAGIRERLAVLGSSMDEFFANDDRFAWPAVVTGAALVYLRARERRRQFRRFDSDAAAHDWRKYVQLHASQMAILEPYGAGCSVAGREALDAVSHCLGEHHDLSMLRDWLDTQKGRETKKSLQAASHAAGTAQAKLREQALDAGRIAFDESAESFAGRLAGTGGYRRRTVMLHGH